MAHGRTEKRILQEWLSQVVQVFSAFINDTDIDDTELTSEPSPKDTFIPKSTYASLVEDAFEKELITRTSLSHVSQTIERDLPMEEQITENKQEDEEDTFLPDDDNYTTPSTKF